MGQLKDSMADCRVMSGVGQMCLGTEKKEAPMCIDLVLPLSGERMTLDDVRLLLKERWVGHDIRLRSRIEQNKFIVVDIDWNEHVREVFVFLSCL